MGGTALDLSAFRLVQGLDGGRFWWPTNCGANAGSGPSHMRSVNSPRKKVFAMLGLSVGEIQASTRELIANQLAGALLLPTDWFQADGTELEWDLLEIKQRYSTASHELIARRMLQMTPSVIVSLFDQGQLIWRRSNVLRRPPPLTVAEKSDLANGPRAQPAEST